MVTANGASGLYLDLTNVTIANLVIRDSQNARDRHRPQTGQQTNPANTGASRFSDNQYDGLYVVTRRGRAATSAPPPAPPAVIGNADSCRATSPGTGTSATAPTSTSTTTNVANAQRRRQRVRRRRQRHRRQHSSTRRFPPRTVTGSGHGASRRTACQRRHDERQGRRQQPSTANGLHGPGVPVDLSRSSSNSTAGDERASATSSFTQFTDNAFTNNTGSGVVGRPPRPDRPGTRRCSATRSPATRPAASTSPGPTPTSPRAGRSSPSTSTFGEPDRPTGSGALVNRQHLRPPTAAPASPSNLNDTAQGGAAKNSTARFRIFGNNCSPTHDQRPQLVDPVQRRGASTSAPRGDVASQQRQPPSFGQIDPDHRPGRSTLQRHRPQHDRRATPATASHIADQRRLRPDRPDGSATVTGRQPDLRRQRHRTRTAAATVANGRRRRQRHPATTAATASASSSREQRPTSSKRRPHPGQHRHRQRPARGVYLQRRATPSSTDRRPPPARTRT